VRRRCRGQGPKHAGGQRLRGSGEVRQHRHVPGGRDVQQVVAARVDDDPAAPVSHHVVRVGVVRDLARYIAEAVRRLRVIGRESGEVDNLGLPARDQLERAERVSDRLGQQVVAAVRVHQEVIDRHRFLPVPEGDRGGSGHLMDGLLVHRGKVAEYRGGPATIRGNCDDVSRRASAERRRPRPLGGRAGRAVRRALGPTGAGLRHHQARRRQHEVSRRIQPPAPVSLGLAVVALAKPGTAAVAASEAAITPTAVVAIRRIMVPFASGLHREPPVRRQFPPRPTAGFTAPAGHDRRTLAHAAISLETVPERMLRH
jgi:hypothetical protein